MTKLHHCPFAGVVTRQHQINTIIEAAQQLSQVARAAGNVLRWIVWPANTESSGGPGHQLHQATRTLRRHGVRVEVLLLLHHQEDQVGIDSVFATVLANQVVK